MIHLFVSSFGNDTSWIRMRNVSTIEVGMARRDEASINQSNQHVLCDNWGRENISEANPNFGELTGLYWLWKNMCLGDDEIVGYCHYNKKLKITEACIADAIIAKNTDWIVLEPHKGKANPYLDDRKVFYDVLSRFPDKRYRDTYDQNWDLGGNSIDEQENVCGGQLFYTTVWEFKRYCEFLFAILLEVYETIGDVDRDPYYRRYCAFMGEGMLSLYLMTNKKQLLYAPLECNDSIFYTYARSIANKLHLNRDSYVYGRIRDLLGQNRISSYRKGRE